MNKEDKELLLKDLCCRLPYGVRCYAYQFKIDGNDCECHGEFVGFKDGYFYLNNRVSINEGKTYDERYSDVKPYLRPMPSMTNEEKEALLNLLFDKEARIFYIDEEGQIDGKTTDLMKEGINYPSFCPINITMYIDFLNAHHFDYRGLIEMGLALEATEEMYNIK